MQPPPPPPPAPLSSLAPRLFGGMVLATAVFIAAARPANALGPFGSISSSAGAGAGAPLQPPAAAAAVDEASAAYQAAAAAAAQQQQQQRWRDTGMLLAENEDGEERKVGATGVVAAAEGGCCGGEAVHVGLHCLLALSGRAAWLFWHVPPPCLQAMLVPTIQQAASAAAMQARMQTNQPTLWRVRPAAVLTALHR